MRSVFLLLFFLFITHALSAQQRNSDALLLRYADTTTASTIRKHATHYIVKFNNYPGANWLREHGLVRSAGPLHHILQFLPDTTGTTNITVIYPANANWKSSEKLLRQLEIRNGDVAVLAALDTAHAAPLLYCTINEQHSSYALVTVQKKYWPLFIAQHAVRFADITRRAHTEAPVTIPNPGINSVNTLRYYYPALQGMGAPIGLKEELFDTTDIDLPGKLTRSALLPDKTSTHATAMATIIAGVGNSGPGSLGVAPLARLSSSSFNRLLPDDETHFRQLGIAVQNHSYGTGTENYYGIEAAAYDAQVYRADTLVHVFSSGNAGTGSPADGLYRGLQGFANLSGTFKQAKNVLVVGGTNGAQAVPPLSSRGPAYDGRIKPEIVAYGENGTSDAAAVTTGVIALLQEFYRQKHGRAPSAALIKAVLVNSASEINDEPLQYARGYGSLNALGAIATLNEERYASGSLQPGGAQTVPLQLPASLWQLKVTLAWNDPAAETNTATALVNDLNLVLIAPDGQVFRPWVLNTFPAKDSLLRAAKREIDTLNNIEQVSVTNPLAGTWKIQVNTGKMKTPAQPFQVTWKWTAGNFFQWHSPVAGEVLPNNQRLTLRWHTGSKDIARAYYSLDSGATWTHIAEVSLRAGSLEWRPPQVFSGARLKMVTRDTSWESGDFKLSAPLPLYVGFNCSDSLLLYWPSLPGATGYEIYRIENNRLSLFRSIKDTLTVIHRNDILSGHFAVSPVHKDSWKGIKGNTLDYRQQPIDCYFKNLLADVKEEKQVLVTVQLGSLYRVKKVYFERRQGNDFIEAGSENVSTSATLTFLDSPPHAGILTYRIRLLLDNGSTVYSRPVSAVLHGDKDHQIFPNPADRFVNIVSRTLNDHTILITDNIGRTVVNVQLTNFVQQIPVYQLSPGIYLITILQSGKKIRTEKLVVVRN